MPVRARIGKKGTRCMLSAERGMCGVVDVGSYGLRPESRCSRSLDDLCKMERKK